MRRWLRTAALAAVIVAAALLLALALVASFSDAAVTAARFRTLHTEHSALTAFLRSMS